jgi:hypothetical protein
MAWYRESFTLPFTTPLHSFQPVCQRLPLPSIFRRVFEMAPNLTTASALFLEATEDSVVYQSKTQKPVSAARSRSALQKVQVEHRDEPDQPAQQYKLDIRWRNVIAFLYLHVFTLYGLYLIFTAAKYQTTIWCKYHQLQFNNTFSRIVQSV